MRGMRLTFYPAAGRRPKGKVKKKIKKTFFNFFKIMLAIFGGCAILFPVMRDTIQVEEVFESSTETVSCTCCGCGEQHHIDRDEAAEWFDLDRFMCWECE